MTETEPEWDDEQRARLLSLARHEAGIGECGFHHSLTSDPANHFTFKVETCTVCAGAAQFARMQAKADEDEAKRLGENPDPDKPRSADGRTTHIRMMSAEEVERRASRN